MPAKRIRILTSIHHYLPGYKSGGPVRTIAHMVDRLGDEFRFLIVTADRDFLENSPYTGITTDTWEPQGKAKVHYTPPDRQGMVAWLRLIRKTPHDILYLNSMFDFRFSILPLFAKRLLQGHGQSVVIAPRGEFSPGALALKKWKKILFLAAARMSGLYRDVLWHASTEDESCLIRGIMGKAANISVAKNLAAQVAPSPRTHRKYKENTIPRVVFVSRISRMKNLDYALGVLAEAAVPLHFDIWGTLEDEGYWEECQTLIHAMPKHIAVRYCGAVDHDNVVELVSQYDLFFLPTRGENYGHVIVEALTAGTPVLLSDATPWRNLHDHGVGWDLPLEDGRRRFVEAIEEVAKMSAREKERLRQRVLAYAEKVLEDPDHLQANRDLFRVAMSNRLEKRDRRYQG